MLNIEALKNLIEQVGALLQERSRAIEVVAIGGGSLLLLGYIKRPTRDLDLVAVVENGGIRRAEPMPAELQSAIDDVSNLNGIDAHWMNAAPSSLVDLGLPVGFMSRTVQQTYGGLVLHLASREDQIALKLYAAVDQGPSSKHTSDLKQLNPTPDELLSSARWAVTHDVSPDFRSQLVQALAHFGVDDDASF